MRASQQGHPPRLARPSGRIAPMTGNADLRAARLAGKSARRIVHEELRRRIVELELPPGTALSEAELAGSFGVSRTPVRESLLLLADEGLVDVFPQRGSFVGAIDFDDVVTAQFVRESLECTSLEQAGASFAASDITRLRDLLTLQRRSDERSDAAAFFTLDEAFHRTLMEAGRHGSAWPIVSQAKGQMDRARRLSLPADGKMTDLIAQHTSVVDALEDGDIETAVGRLRAHLRVVLADIERLRSAHPDLFSQY